MYKFLDKYLKYFLIAALIYMPLFGYLTDLPIRVWDEARVALNAYEMYNNGNFIVTYYDGEPDMWNTKPPLLIWIQVFLMKIIGVNELSIRLPSAFAALFTCIAILVISLRYLKNFWFGFIAIMVLITSQGYVSIHAVRTGDYDALLSFFTTLSCLFLFAFFETQKTKHLYWFFAVTAFAVLTKGISGFLFVPGYIVYTIIKKQVVPLLKNKHFYIGLISMLALIAGYYLLREMNNPGYFAAVQKNELGGRFLEVVESHEGGFWFYYQNFIHFQLSEWYLLVPCGIVLGLAVKDPRLKKLVTLSSVMLLSYFLVISVAKTKLLWYDVPMYPFLAIVISAFLWFVFETLKNFSWFNQKLTYNPTPLIFLFIILITPYQNIINKTYKPKDPYWEKDFYDVTHYLQKGFKGKTDLNGHSLVFNGYSANNKFYYNLLRDKGVNIEYKNFKDLEPGDIAVTYQDEIREYIESNYIFEKISTIETVVNYKINGRKVN